MDLKNRIGFSIPKGLSTKAFYTVSIFFILLMQTSCNFKNRGYAKLFDMKHNAINPMHSVMIKAQYPLQSTG